MIIGWAFYNKAVEGVCPRHLNVVIGAAPNNLFVVANLTTNQDEGHGPSIGNRDWNKVSEMSWCAPRFSRVVAESELQFLARNHLLQTTSAAPCWVVEAMQLAVLESVFVSDRVKEVLVAGMADYQCHCPTHESGIGHPPKRTNPRSVRKWAPSR